MASWQPIMSVMLWHSLTQYHLLDDKATHPAIRQKFQHEKLAALYPLDWSHSTSENELSNFIGALPHTLGFQQAFCDNA